jgi:hypothetical protein
MKDRIFRRLLYSLVGGGLALTVSHFIYGIYAYQHCSIIEFIAREPW